MYNVVQRGAVRPWIRYFEKSKSREMSCRTAAGRHYACANAALFYSSKADLAMDGMIAEPGTLRANLSVYRVMDVTEPTRNCFVFVEVTTTPMWARTLYLLLHLSVGRGLHSTSGLAVAQGYYPDSSYTACRTDEDAFLMIIEMCWKRRTAFLSHPGFHAS